MYGRDLDGAIEAFRKAIEIAPTFEVAHSNLGVLFTIQGRYTDAFSEYDQGVPGWGYLRGITYVLARRRADAQRLVEEMEQRAKREYVSPASRGLIWVLL